MSLKPGPLVFGGTLLLLSLHPFVVGMISEMLSLGDAVFEHYLGSVIPVVLGLAFIAYGSFGDGWRRRRDGGARDVDDPEAS